MRHRLLTGDRAVALLALAATFRFAACGDNPVGITPAAPAIAPAYDLTPTVPTAEVEKLFVCKEGPAGTYNFTAVLTPTTLKYQSNGVTPVLLADAADGTVDGQASFTVAAGSCVWIALGGGSHPANERTITVTETPIAGTEFVSTTVNQRTGGPSGPIATSTAGNPASAVIDGTEGATMLFKNQTIPGGSLSISKSAGSATVDAGSNISFTIQVSSDGPGDAENVVLTDVLPTGTGISWSINPAVSGCSITSGTLTCSFGTMAVNTTKSVTIESSTAYESCGTYTNTAGVSADNITEVQASASTTVECPGYEGCTPGFWKQANHFQYWTSPYTTSTLLKNVFSGSVGYFTDKGNKPLGDQTMLKALGFQGGNSIGGAAEILLRAATAGVLNAANPNVNYPRSISDLVTSVNTALGSGNRDTILTLAGSIDSDNNLGCTANR